MISQLADRVLGRIVEAASSYHRLVVLVAPSGVGKTHVFQEVSRRVGVPVINLNLTLSESMLELTEQQRILQLPQLVNDLIEAQPGSLCLLDNIEIIFDTALQHDPLRLLLGISRNKTVAVTWNGSLSDGHLVYAEPSHPEYQYCPVSGFLVVTAEL